MYTVFVCVYELTLQSITMSKNKERERDKTVYNN